MGASSTTRPRSSVTPQRKSGPLAHEHRLGAEVRQIAVGGPAEAVVIHVEILDQRTHGLVAEGGVAVAFQHEAEAAVQMLLLPGLSAV